MTRDAWSSALAPGVRRREVFGWAMYDFANSGYTTVTLTAVYNAFFVAVIAERAPWATFAWTAALSLSYLLVMVAAPPLGAWADAHAGRRRLLAGSTLGCIAATAALALPGRGDVGLAVALVVASNACYSLGEAAIAAFLPEIARPESLGRVSGWGWSFGYLGGMFALGLALAWVLSSQARGVAADVFVPQTMLIVAVVYAAAAVPTFAWLRERPAPGAGGGSDGAWRRLARTARHARRYRDFGALLACAVFYQAGIAVVITLAAVYAEAVMHFDTARTMALVFTVNIAAAIGAFAFGHLQDRLGHLRTLAATIVGWLAMVAIAGLSTRVEAFWVAAGLAGLCMGSSQSAGRALAGAMAPRDRLGEFYGLWTVAVRIASILGPLTYGAVTWVTDGNHRLGILSTGVFFLIGLALLARIDVSRGRAAAASI